MRQRVTVSDAKAARIANVLNVKPEDPRFMVYLNEAIERLVEGTKGKFVGSTQKYKVCVSNGCITWPRQIETIEAVSVCTGHTLTIRNQWFEFLEHGNGLRKETDGCPNNLFDRGHVVSFEDIRGTDKKLKVYCDISTDADDQILLQGYNQDGNWIQTWDGTQWLDGELINPSPTGAVTNNFFTALTGVQKPVTDGVIRLYELNTNDDTQRAMAIYEPDETRPTYRRSLIAGLSNAGACSGASGDCPTKAVTVMAKMAFLPVYKDTDWLLIQSIPAIRFMCQAIRKEENNLWDDAAKYEAKALKILDDQLQNHEGDGVVATIRMPPNEVYGGGVLNVL